MWFNKDRKKKMEVIQNYIPTSKAQLIQVAMFYNNGDVQKAQDMFDFYSRNLNLPDFDPVAPTFMQQIRGNFSDFYSWIKENQEDLVQGYQFIQSVIKNKGTVPPAESPLPPIND